MRPVALQLAEKFFKLVLLYCIVHAALWLPVICLCISLRPDHMRPMGEWPASFLFSLTLFLRGSYVAAVQLFVHRSLKFALLTLLLSVFPFIILIGTEWFITQIIGIPFATS